MVHSSFGQGRSPSRSVSREAFADPVRIRLLETDMDAQESGLAAMSKDIRSIRNMLMGFLASLTTASVLLAINLVVVNSGG